MKSKTKYTLLALLFTICLISSAILAFAPINEVCNIDGKGCDLVQNSKYAYTFGIKNSYLGVIIFTILLITTLLQIKNPTENKKKLINIAVIIGSAIAVYFIYLQKFVLFAYCTYCLITDFSLLLALIIILVWWEK